MIEAVQSYSPDEWARAGRGRELQFFATDAEVEAWLGRLPQEFAPYTIWSPQLESADGASKRVVGSRALHDWVLSRINGSQDPVSRSRHFFVHAGAVMPNLPVVSGVMESANEWASLNGLILVQHGATRKQRQLESRIAVTDEVRNKVSGKTVALSERVLVFDALRRMVDESLCFASIQVFKDGHEEEDERQLMTVGAARLAGEGRLVRRAGRRLSR